MCTSLLPRHSPPAWNLPRPLLPSPTKIKLIKQHTTRPITRKPDGLDRGWRERETGTSTHSDLDKEKNRERNGDKLEMCSRDGGRCPRELCPGAVPMSQAETSKQPIVVCRRPATFRSAYRPSLSLLTMLPAQLIFNGNHTHTMFLLLHP